jgi:hypothetical protein
MRKIRWTPLEYSRLARQFLSNGFTSASPDLDVAASTFQMLVLPKRRWRPPAELQTPQAKQDI